MLETEVKCRGSKRRDRNTKCFHKMVYVHRISIFINGLKVNSVWLSLVSDINSGVSTFFQ